MSQITQFFAAALAQFRDVLRRASYELIRQRRAQVVVAAAISIVCAVVIVESTLTARSHRQQWSRGAQVVVLAEPVPAHALLTSQNTRVISLPPAVIPANALRQVPANARLRVSLDANAVLSASLIIPAEDTVTIPHDWRVIALPSDVVAPPVEIGDKVDLIAGDSVLASNCIIASTSPYAVAVPQDVASAVATASRVGDIAIASYAWNS